MKNLFPVIYITFINTYFSFFSSFPPKKLRKVQRYKPKMGIWTDINVILILQTVFNGLLKPFLFGLNELDFVQKVRLLLYSSLLNF